MMDFGGLHIPRELGECLGKLIESHNEIEAIRLLRETMGIDLKTAKDAIDCYKKTNGLSDDREFQKGKIRVSKVGVIVVLICLLALAGFAFRDMIQGVIDEITAPALKPVIYLYPEEELDVTVKIDLDGEFICTYPAYNDGWDVTASPDGTLIEKNTGLEYSYLFWEGTSDVKYDMTKGFVVAGEDTAEFLQKTLAMMGLTPREYNEFIVYWLPQMENNPYNLITFQQELYTEYAKLEINPTPDSVLRVFMAYQPLDEPIEVEKPDLESFERIGFTVVEWGGTKVN